MTREEVCQKLNEVFQSVESEDGEEMSSLARAQMIVSVEVAFGIHFSMGEISVMSGGSVGAMADLILKKLS